MNNYPFEGLKSLSLQLGACHGSMVRGWRALPLTAILAVLGFLVPAQIVHAQGGMCTMCEIGRGLPGQCTPEFMASCRGKKGTGETSGGNTPRDSKTKAPGTEPSKSGATKNTKVGPTLPDVESLTGKSKTNEGWGGGRSSDTRTKEQRYPPQAKQTVESLQNLTGGGKPPPEGWGGGLKSDSRTIEQKLDTP